MTNTSRPRLTIPADAGRLWKHPTSGRVYNRMGTKWRHSHTEPVEKPERVASERQPKARRQAYIALNDRQRIKPFIAAMTGWQVMQWQGKGRPVDRAHLLFHVCFQKPPKRPLSADEGMTLVDRQINLAIARKLGQPGPRQSLNLSGKPGLDSHALMRAYKAGKDFLARQRQRWMARRTRAAQR